MAYMHISNLYKSQEILLFRECYAMEKLHGTSAHIGLKDDKITFFSGGVAHVEFLKLFDAEALKEKMAAIVPEMVVYGEAYGGKCQGMSATYGKELRFAAFEVKIGETWLCVPGAHDVVLKLGLDFVSYDKGPATVEWIESQRDADSEQAIRNGMGVGKMREGVVVRPLMEMRLASGERVIVKHKREEFRETATLRKVDTSRLEVLADAQKITLEWVTPMRLQHVVDKVRPAGIEDTGTVIKAMLEDVEREATGEVVLSREARRMMGAKAAQMFKQSLQKAAIIAGGGYEVTG